MLEVPTPEASETLLSFKHQVCPLSDEAHGGFGLVVADEVVGSEIGIGGAVARHEAECDAPEQRRVWATGTCPGIV